MTRPVEPPPVVMTRAMALRTATEHMTTLATNSRGFIDGVPFRDRVDAVERFARFLIDEGDNA